MIPKKLAPIAGILIPACAAALVILLLANLNLRLRKVEMSMAAINLVQENLSRTLPEELYEDHLKLVENRVLASRLKDMEVQLQTLSTSKSNVLLINVNNSYALYQDYLKKLARNNQVNLKSDTVSANLDEWGNFLLEQKFEELLTAITEQNKTLDADYQNYLATLPVSTPPSGGGYSYISVNTERGSFSMYLIKVSKSSVSVKTIAAIEDDCENDCATKTLEQYVKDNNAYAGIAGSYSCPADYSQCSDKKWSFDFALYDSNDGKWFNKGARSWGDTGMFTFSGGSSKFYEESSDYDGDGVSAAISNYPSLVKNGEIVVDDDDVDSYQKTKGLRGVLGSDDDNLYLAYISNASVIDAAYAIRSAGAKNALNLDGGGSAAMYVGGGYVVGPGRPLPNVILLIK